MSSLQRPGFESRQRYFLITVLPTAQKCSRMWLYSFDLFYTIPNIYSNTYLVFHVMFAVATIFTILHKSTDIDTASICFELRPTRANSKTNGPILVSILGI